MAAFVGREPSESDVEIHFDGESGGGYLDAGEVEAVGFFDEERELVLEVEEGGHDGGEGLAVGGGKSTRRLGLAFRRRLGVGEDPAAETAMGEGAGGSQSAGAGVVNYFFEQVGVAIACDVEVEQAFGHGPTVWIGAPVELRFLEADHQFGGIGFHIQELLGEFRQLGREGDTGQHRIQLINKTAAPGSTLRGIWRR